MAITDRSQAKIYHFLENIPGDMGGRRLIVRSVKRCTSIPPDMLIIT